ncbi:serine hydrolase domain-containing protein [Galbibacter mesophilus]|uniref:serine hydrolase domain-containing protein n=1 Tax=Galbibacter mesophilus TaxID=379069 RepID=UPI00191D87D8|nr:serine hydrolase [Galbibacter mesophilus]MCM5662371.1 beta-lactamase family protein [Galbibacter mesophilus]
MKIVLRIIKFILFLTALLIIALYIFGYDYLIKAVNVTYLNGHSTAFLEDYKYFDNQLIQKGNHPEPWPQSKNYNTKLSPELDELNKTYKSVSFLIIKNDSLYREKYYENYTETSKSNSFSMAKTLVVTLMQKAIQQGYIESMEQPVADFYPQFNSAMGKKLTVGDLAAMSSGLNWDEAYYSPFSITTRAYFDDDLAKVILGLEVVEEPGKSFKYLSGNTQLLAMIIEKATKQSLANYLSRNFWQPMGAENIALWQLDSEENGLVKAYCCIAATARDFSRFGKLYKNSGNWNGTQMLDSSFVSKATRPHFENGEVYGLGLWLLNFKNKDFFMLRGHLGQYVIIQPEDNIMITRLGHSTAKKGKDAYTEDIYQYIEETYKILGDAL